MKIFLNVSLASALFFSINNLYAASCIGSSYEFPVSQTQPDYEASPIFPQTIDVVNNASINFTAIDDPLSYIVWCVTAGELTSRDQRNTSIEWVLPEDFRSSLVATEIRVTVGTPDGERSFSRRFSAVLGDFGDNIGVVKPHTPSPVDESVLIESPVQLEWQGGSNNLDEAVTYDVFLMAESSRSYNKVCEKINLNYCVVDGLENAQQYSWYIVSFSQYGASVNSPVWSFSTGAESSEEEGKVPMISGLSVGDVSRNSFKIIAITISNGKGSTLDFDYGRTVSFGTNTGDIGVGSSVSQKQTIYEIDNLLCGRNYFVRARIRNADGVDYSETIQVVTRVCPELAPVESVPTTLISRTSARLNAYVTPINGTTFDFELGKTSLSGQFTSSIGVGSDGIRALKSIVVSNLECSTTYYFRPRTRNSAGANFGLETTFDSSPCSVLATVYTGSVTEITKTVASLNASVSPNGNGTTLDFQYGETESLGETSASIGAGSSFGLFPGSISIDNLACGTQYFYRARARNTAGAAFGETLSFGTSSCLELAPVETIAASLVGRESARLNARVTPINGTTLDFEIGKELQSGNFTSSIGVGSDAVAVIRSIDVTNLECGTNYYVRSRSRNGDGANFGQEVTFTTDQCLVLAKVTTELAKGLGRQHATLNGTVNPNGNGTTLDFEYGETTKLINLTNSVGVGSGTDDVMQSYTIRGLNCGTIYYFRARARNAAGVNFGDIRELETSVCLSPSPPTDAFGTDKSIVPVINLLLND